MRKKQTLTRVLIRGVLTGIVFAAIDLLIASSLGRAPNAQIAMLSGYVISIIYAIDQMEGGQ